MVIVHSGNPLWGKGGKLGAGKIDNENEIMR
jgi:hypothetical protein